jgi:hypothetical protein
MPAATIDQFGPQTLCRCRRGWRYLRVSLHRSRSAFKAKTRTPQPGTRTFRLTQALHSYFAVMVAKIGIENWTACPTRTNCGMEAAVNSAVYMIRLATAFTMQRRTPAAPYASRAAH